MFVFQTPLPVVVTLQLSQIIRKTKEQIVWVVASRGDVRPQESDTRGDSR